MALIKQMACLSPMKHKPGMGCDWQQAQAVCIHLAIIICVIPLHQQPRCDKARTSEGEDDCHAAAITTIGGVGTEGSWIKLPGSYPVS